MNDSILVTGAAGWLGQTLIRKLANDSNSPIRGLVLPRQKSAGSGAKLQFVEGDLRNPADCDRFCANSRGGLLFHTAGMIHPQKVKEFYEVNVEGTRNLLAAAIRAGVKRAVIVSSNSPCGCNPHPDHQFDEESPYRPYMHYGRSKMLMELAIQEKQKQGAIETVIVRAPWFYGPHQPARQSLFFTMIRDGKAPIVGNGENLRSMSYVDNLAEGLVLAARHPKANGQIYWIADARPYSMNEVVNTVERLLENEFGQTCAHKRLRLPGIASEVAWFVDKSLQAVGLYHQKIHVLSEMNKTIACTIEKAREELGYNPQVALEEGMRRSLAWCREQRQGPFADR